MKSTHEAALAYLKRVGGSINVVLFDEDHEPIGAILRFELCDLNLTREEAGVLFLRTDFTQE